MSMRERERERNGAGVQRGSVYVRFVVQLRYTKWVFVTCQWKKSQVHVTLNKDVKCNIELKKKKKRDTVGTQNHYITIKIK